MRRSRIKLINPDSPPRPEAAGFGAFIPEGAVPFETDAHKHMQYARGNLIAPRNSPYLASAAMSLTMIPVNGIGSLGVDNSWRLYYDPDVVIYWPVEALAAVIEHEIWHLLRQHAARAQEQGVTEQTHKRWNWAADAEIHSDETLVQRMQQIPGSESMITPETLGLPPKNLSEYYFAEMKVDPDQGEGRGGKEGEGEGRGEEGKDGRGGPADPVKGKSGSSSDGIQKSWEKPKTDENVNIADEKNIRKLVAEAIKIGAKRAGGPVSSSAIDWAEDELALPKVDWRDLIRHAIEDAITYQSGDIEYTYSRLSRRQAASPGFLLPGTWEPVPEVAIVLDTSGSMLSASKASGESAAGKEGRHYGTVLMEAMNEVAGILEEFGQDIGVQIFATDTSVGWAERVFDIQDVELVGGGGTDLGEGLEQVNNAEERPNIVIGLTDGYTPWPAEPPWVGENISSIIGIIGSTEEELATTYPPPKWADEVIYIDD